MRSRAQAVYNKTNPANINDLDIQRRMDYEETKKLRGDMFGSKNKGSAFGRLG